MGTEGSCTLTELIFRTKRAVINQTGRGRGLHDTGRLWRPKASKGESDPSFFLSKNKMLGKGPRERRCPLWKKQWASRSVWASRRGLEKAGLSCLEGKKREFLKESEKEGGKV